MRDGYCRHGVYVGGIGVDRMCGRCESGDDETRLERVKRLRHRAWEGVFQREASDRQVSWWARWWYRLDDALVRERQQVSDQWRNTL